MLDPNTIKAMPMSDEAKAILYKGEIAEALRQSPAWKLILDWAEGRCSDRLGHLRKARWAADEVKVALSTRWQLEEDWLQSFQVYILGLIADRDALINDFASVENDMRVQDIPLTTEEIQPEG